MEIKGTVKQIMAVQTGVSAKGNWQKQELLLTTQDKYPADILITCMGKVVDSIEQLTEGMTVTASINISSREYNGKYYNSINAWKLDFSGGKGYTTSTKDVMAVTPVNSQEDDSSLPF